MIRILASFSRIALPVITLAALAFTACTRSETALSKASDSSPQPSILLITLDTTRADSIGPEAKGVETPAFNAVARRGLRFRQAYATTPQTLPSHSSMMTGLYPGGHGVHENSRFLGAEHPLIAERLRSAGYRTAAFVSAFPLARRFGLARGFEVYDDELPPGREERSSAETTARAMAYLERAGNGPLFLWVHYFDPHYPYEPPESFRGGKYADDPYRGEIAAMDSQLAQVVRAFEERVQGPAAIIISGDHGESLGEHGEAQHGNLVYQGAMHVPLVIAGPGVGAAVSDVPVSIRRIFHTILDWAGLGAEYSLRGPDPEVVVGEAMIPFLQYGWQPQVMAIDGRQKVIRAGALEVYDIVADPREQRDLGGSAAISREIRRTLREYPVPSPAAASSGEVTDEDRRRLASLGYVASETKPVVRKDAPRPRDMAHLFPLLDQASLLFARGDYERSIPVLQKILAQDPQNLMIAIRLAVAHSALGHDEEAEKAFRKAQEIAPDSPDVRHYLAMHYVRSQQWKRAVPLLERVVAESPDRLPAIEALALIRERQGRLDDALQLRQRVRAMKALTAAELSRIGRLAMATGQTAVAIDAFEKARQRAGAAFQHDLELGVLYLAAQRLHEAREALERVPPSHPEYPMALFKRAQVSVLLNEPDRDQRIARARQHANASTRDLIANERLFATP